MKKFSAILDLVLKAVGMAMGVAALVISFLGVAETETLITLLGIGVFCLGLAALSNVDDQALDEI